MVGRGVSDRSRRLRRAGLTNDDDDDAAAGRGDDASLARWSGPLRAYVLDRAAGGMCESVLIDGHDDRRREG
jgi:hypothetical protein